MDRVMKGILYVVIALAVAYLWLHFSAYTSFSVEPTLKSCDWRVSPGLWRALLQGMKYEEER